MATPIHINFACGPYDRTQALQNGDITPAGINLNYIAIDHPRDIFDRMAGGGEFDACEMSASEYICQYSAGERKLVAIPVFPSRAFRHSFIAINDRTIKKPTDLNGKRIGVQLYTMTAAVWIRGVLQQCGVDLSSVTWIEGAMEKPGPHGKPSAKPLLRPVKRVPNDSGKSLSQLLEDGEIDATIGKSYSKKSLRLLNFFRSGSTTMLRQSTPCKEAVSRLQGRGNVLLQADRHLSYHASRGHPAGAV